MINQIGIGSQIIDKRSYRCNFNIIGASLGKPHLVCSMYGWKRYVCLFVAIHSDLKFLLCLPATIWHAVVCILSDTGRKWLPFANISHFPCRALQMITISNETKAGVQPCPPNDVCCETGNTSNYYSCTVYALQFQTTLQRG